MVSTVSEKRRGRKREITAAAREEKNDERGVGIMMKKLKKNRMRTNIK